MNVLRQSVHKWLSRYKRFGIDGLMAKKKTGCTRAHNRTSHEIEQLVIALAHKHRNDEVETFHDCLMYENNTELHPTTIYRILKRNNVRYTTNYPSTRKKWKKKLYAHETPGKELQMDTKYPFGYKGVKEGRVIYTIIDDATRRVFAWTYEKTNKTKQYRLSLFLQYYNWRKKYRGLEMDGMISIERLQKWGSVHLTLRCYGLTHLCFYAFFLFRK